MAISWLLRSDLTHWQLQYYENWVHILQGALSSRVLRNGSCREGCKLEACTNHILYRLSVGLESLSDLDAMFVLTKACCTAHRKVFSSWHQSLEESIQNIPSFEPFTTRELQSMRPGPPRYVMSLLPFNSPMKLYSSYDIFYPEGPRAVSRHCKSQYRDGKNEICELVCSLCFHFGCYLSV